jgi:hypothetical protein
MTADPLAPSPRLRSAVENELQRISRRRAELEEQAKRLRGELEAIEREQRQAGERADQLRDLLSGAPTPAEGLTPPPGIEILRGVKIRTVAVRLLWEASGEEPIHYVEWHEMLREAGYAVIGKRASATFLTAVGRSPIVRPDEEPGWYRIDRGLRAEIERDLAAKQAELRDLSATLADGWDARLRANRNALMSTIRRLERALVEADESVPTDA